MGFQESESDSLISFFASSPPPSPSYNLHTCSMKNLHPTVTKRFEA